MAGKGVNLKIVMLGEGRVGKTSLVLRYCKDTFSDKQVSTIQASYLTKRINLGSTTCNLSIWVRALCLSRSTFVLFFFVQVQSCGLHTLPQVYSVVMLQDTAGQERFHALGPIYYRDADGALLVYDITDADSFTKVKQWVKELRKMVGNDIQIAVAGNKVDLERQRTVSEDDAIAFVQSVGGTHHGTSAKANRGIDPMFLDITKRK